MYFQKYKNSAACQIDPVSYTHLDVYKRQELYTQLPLTLEVIDFSTNEKTFYPPEALDVSDTPPANAGKGTLAYYSLWEDVVMFYDHFGEGSNLYELGKAVSGTENIEKLAGTITVAVFQE